MYGVNVVGGFDLVFNMLAVFELLLFSGVCFPHFAWKNIEMHAFPHGWKGVWAAVPFAVWFFVGLEGVANVAEQTVRPQRNILLGVGAALVAVIVLLRLG